jgi:hypothetical protein
VLDVGLLAAVGGGSVRAVLTQPFQHMPLSSGGAAVAAAAAAVATEAAAAPAAASHGLHFVSPVTGGSFSSSMPLLVLLHIDFQVVALSSRWTLQVLLQLLLLLFCRDTFKTCSFLLTAAPFRPASCIRQKQQLNQDMSYCRNIALGWLLLHAAAWCVPWSSPWLPPPPCCS